MNHKLITTIITIIALTTTLYGQYTPFPENNAIWKSNEMKGMLARESYEYPNPNGNFDTRIYYLKGDTMINNVLCRKIFEKTFITFDSTSYAYYGALREDLDNKKVYFRNSNWEQEKLIFNFNLQVNDTIRDWYSLDSLPTESYFVVKNIVKKKYRANSLIERNVYELEAFNLPSWAYTFSSVCILYEGIGFNLGFLKSPIYATKSNRQFRQSCYSDETVEIFDCESNNIGASESDLELSKLFTLYPNPATHMLQINTNFEIATMNIHNSSGTAVLRPNGKIINIQELPVGLYLLEAIDNKGNRLVKKFEKR